MFKCRIVVVQTDKFKKIEQILNYIDEFITFVIFLPL